MIVNIRGTSGSGKSTLIRRVVAGLELERTLRVEGRKQPLGYVYREPKSGANLFVPGHYETPCGGCDTITTMDQIFDLVDEHHVKGHHVIFEGLLISSEYKRTAALWQRMVHDGKGDQLLLVALDVPVEVCLDSVNARRKAKNPDKSDVNPKNTISKHKGVTNTMGRLRDLGVHTVSLDREEAYIEIRREIFGA